MPDNQAIARRINELTDRDTLKAIASDIGADVAFYIQDMFPDAVAATRSRSFLLSVRNHTYNQIMAAVESKYPAEQRIVFHEMFRRHINRLKKCKSLESVQRENERFEREGREASRKFRGGV